MRAVRRGPGVLVALLALTAPLAVQVGLAPLPAQAVTCGSAPLDVVTDPARTDSVPVTSGVDVRRFWGHSHDGNVIQVSVTTADLRRVKLAPIAGNRVGRIATTESLAADAGALLAVNGDFFRMNTSSKALPSGALLGAGLRYAPAGSHPYVGTDVSGRPLTGHAVTSGVVQASDPRTRRVLAKLSLGAVNASPSANGIAVFTATLDPANSRRGDWQVLVRRGRIAASAPSLTTDLTRLPRSDAAFVVSARGAAVNALARLPKGTAVSWSGGLVDERTGTRLAGAVGAGPRVLAAGRVTGPCRRSYRARTMVAWDAAGTTVWLVTLTSNHPERWIAAAGADYRQLGAIARDLGASDAVLLDGGGSTTMVARTGGHLQRVDADDSRRQREVADGLALFRR